MKLNQSQNEMTLRDAAISEEVQSKLMNSPVGNSLDSGRYTLLRMLGQGGMGTVWLAQQTIPFRRTVAIKFLRGGLSDRHLIARFEAERQALAMLDHANIAKILDAGATENGMPYFVMECVDGIPLTEHCETHGLRVHDRLQLFVEICNAVHHAHQRGIIHRDLKPSNLLVELRDGLAVPKVIDFGLAKTLQYQHKLTDKTLFTEYGHLIGTLQYMSPEQAEMNSVELDQRTDVFSLGVVLYELLVGSTPIQKESIGGSDLQTVLALIRDEVPKRPSIRLSASLKCRPKATSGSDYRATLSHQLTSELDWIAMKSLEKDRDRRYKSVGHLAEDLIRFMSNQPIDARPPSRIYSFRKTLRRHRSLLAMFFALSVVALLGVAGTTYGLRQTKAPALTQALKGSDRSIIDRSSKAANSTIESLSTNDGWADAKKDLQLDRLILNVRRTEELYGRHDTRFAASQWELADYYLGDEDYPRAEELYLECLQVLAHTQPGTSGPGYSASLRQLENRKTTGNAKTVSALQRVLDQHWQAIGNLDSVPLTYEMRKALLDSRQPVIPSERRLHDFGTLARASKSEHRFFFINKFPQDLHVASVRSSCGCVTAIVETKYVKFGEVGSILARFNTRTFTGSKSATITVSFDGALSTEVQLNVKGYIRSDIVFPPSEINFGEVSQGVGKRLPLVLDYAGRDDWEVIKIVSPFDHIKLTIEETSRSAGRVKYQINAKLEDDAPDGRWSGQAVLHTNDKKLTTVPVQVSVHVAPPLQCSPTSISFGRIGVNELISRRLIVKGETPVAILDVTSDQGEVRAGYANNHQSKPAHVLNMSFQNRKLGPFKGKITIKTDIGNLSIPITGVVE